ncbi:MAG: GNAT family N-acetyltransferase [Pseudomonadota bacterium]
MAPDALAALHAACFNDTPRPWTEAEFRELDGHANTLLLTATDPGQGPPQALLVARRAGPEAEILTLCTHPAARRRGHAAQLLDRLDAWAGANRIQDLFLEVAAGNAAARALYATAGFRERGLRRDYYAASGRQCVHALVLGKSLAPSVAPAAG